MSYSYKLVVTADASSVILLYINSDPPVASHEATLAWPAGLLGGVWRRRRNVRRVLFARAGDIESFPCPLARVRQGRSELGAHALEKTRRTECKVPGNMARPYGGGGGERLLNPTACPAGSSASLAVANFDAEALSSEITGIVRSAAVGSAGRAVGEAAILCPPPPPLSSSTNTHLQLVACPLPSPSLDNRTLIRTRPG